MNHQRERQPQIDRTVTLANWLEPPFNRDGFQRVREVVPTAAIRNLTTNIAALPISKQAIGGIPVHDRAGQMVSFVEHLERTMCDAICIVHDGQIVYEEYFNRMRQDTAHLLMSVSKSMCGAALGVSIGGGRVAASDLVCDVAPEFAGTSLHTATVQHLIDMTAGTEFVEDYDLYLDPAGDSPLIEYERQAGYRALDGRRAIGALAHFRTYPLAVDHGTRFDYRSPLTNVVARVLEVVSGIRYPDILSRDLWGPLGQEHGANIMLDPLGFPVAEGGISCSVRDLARFGLAYLDHGVVGNTRVLPSNWVADTWHGTDAAVALFGASDTAWMGSHYRNGWWVFKRDSVSSGLGIFGQFCYVDRETRTVISRLSSFPAALPDDLEAESLAAFATVAASLGA